MPDATAADEHRAFVDGWPALKSTLTAWLGARECATVPEAVQAVVTALPSADYLRAIQSLSVAATQTLTGWLEQAVACVLNAGNWSLIR